MFDTKRYEAMTKVELSGGEREQIGRRFDELAGRFAAIEGISTDGVPPLITVLNLQNVLREDVSKKLLSREELLANAPEQYDGYYKVPGTLD